MSLQFEKEIEVIYTNQEVKIQTNNFNLEYHENNELKYTSLKKYYSDPKILFDEKKQKYYVLDTENSCIDIYTKDKFEIEKSFGKKMYWKDFLRYVKSQYFEGKEIHQLFKDFKLFYPLEFTLKEDFIYIWDTRNYRIVKTDTEKFEEISFMYIDLETKQVEFTADKIIIHSDEQQQEQSYENSEFIKVTEFDKKLKEIYKLSKIETYDEIIEEIEKTEPLLKDWKNYQKRFTDSYFFNEKTIAKLNYYMTVPENCSHIAYNSDKDELLMIQNQNSPDFKVIIVDKNGNIQEITGVNKKFNSIVDCEYLNGKYFLIEGKKGHNKILAINEKYEAENMEIFDSSLDMNIHKVVLLNNELHFLGTDGNFIFKNGEEKLFFDFSFNNNENNYINKYIKEIDNKIFLVRYNKKNIKKNIFYFNKKIITNHNLYILSKPLVIDNKIIFLSNLDKKLSIFDINNFDLLNEYILPFKLDQLLYINGKICLINYKNGLILSLNENQ